MRPAIRSSAKLAFRAKKASVHPRSLANILQSRSAHTIEDFTADLLDAPLRSVQPGTWISPTPAPSEDPLPKTEKEEQIAKARVVFGSRLAGPVERRKAIEAASQVIAGVTVPPKPEEPENCCMSGCVNCVWDTFRDEIEEWAAKSAEARVKMQEQRVKGQGTGMMTKEAVVSGHMATSMDDDGGGSKAEWMGVEEMKSFGQGGQDLFADIPVGIREFMKIEKKLKGKHRKAGTVGG